MENLNSYRLVDKSEFDEINRLAEEAKQTAKLPQRMQLNNN